MPASQTKKVTALLWAVFLVGTILRFLPGFLTRFPVNDGGMFLSMIRDLRSNQFLLPAFTSYNLADIPFAYPPFGLYVGALVSSLLPISETGVLIWLPALTSSAIIPAFYWLSLQIFDSKPKAAIATAIYAFLPGSAAWMIMGGGLTRAFGILFSLLAFGFVYRLFRGGGTRNIWLSILFCSLAVLSHPEVGLQTAGICFAFWLMFGRSFAGLKSALLVALGTALLTASWWLTVILQHGVGPFWSAAHTGIREALWASLFNSFFHTQGNLPILPILTLAGMLTVIRRREWLLILWAFLPFFLDPRNAPAMAAFPMIMLGSEGIMFLNAEFQRAYLQSMEKNKRPALNLSPLMEGILGVILIYLLVYSFVGARGLARLSLAESDRQTMEWVRSNTPAESRFLLITNAGQISPMTDAFQEWFPALSERRSMNTLQGTEWTLGEQFFPYSQQLTALQACRNADCLRDWVAQEQVQFDFLLLQKKRASPELLESLRKDSRYSPHYESTDVVIFEISPELFYISQ